MKAERDFVTEFTEFLKQYSAAMDLNHGLYLRINGYVVFWEILPWEFRWGVYLKFFDEKGIKIDVEWYQGSVFTSCVHTEEKGYQPIRFDHYTREEAQKTSINKAKQIFNQNRK